MNGTETPRAAGIEKAGGCHIIHRETSFRAHPGRARRYRARPDRSMVEPEEMTDLVAEHRFNKLRLVGAVVEIGEPIVTNSIQSDACFQNLVFGGIIINRCRSEEHT